MSIRNKRTFLAMGILCCICVTASALVLFFNLSKVNNADVLCSSYPVRKHLKYTAICPLIAKFPIPAKHILDLLGKPDLSTNTIIHWRGSLFNAESRIFDPPISQWWFYRWERLGVLSAVIALFDPPTEQWWYLEGSDQNYNNAYFFLLSSSGRVIDCDYQPIPKRIYANWQEFPLASP